MNTFAALAVLLLEAAFTALFARSVYAGLAVITTLAALLVLRHASKPYRLTVIPCIPALLYCLWQCRLLAPMPFLLMLSAQQLQTFSWWLAPARRGDSGASADDAALAGAVFVACSLVTAYFALAGTAIPPPPVSRAMGTFMLLLSILALDTRRGEAAHVGQAAGSTPLVRAAVILTMAYLALLAASPLAGPSVNAVSSMLAQLDELLSRDSKNKTTRMVRLRRGVSTAGNTGPGRWPGELLSDPDSPHVHLKVHNPQEARWLARRPIYLRVATHDTFRDAGWTNAATVSRRIADGDDGVADNIINLGRATSPSVTYSVYTRFHAAGLMPLIPSVTAIHLPAVLRRAGDTYSSPLTENLFRFSYTVTSTPKLWSDVYATSPEPGIADDDCLGLPDSELSDRISELARSVVGASPQTGEMIHRLASYLRAQHTYTRRWPGTVDPPSLESFLFDARPGNCQAFASALALTLRSLDVPARVGLGYCAGEYDPAAGVYSFYADHAHAWTEVYFKEHGWVVVDATPPSRTTIAHHDNDSVDLSLFPGLAGLLDKGVLAEGSGLHAIVSAAILLFNIALVMAVAATVLLSRRRGDALGRALSNTASTTAVPEFYRLFCRTFGRAGHPIRTGQTALEYLAALKSKQLLHDDCDDIIRYLYRICYENARRNPREERRIKARLRGLPRVG